MITTQQKQKIQSTVSVFETSRLMPAYNIITILPDGPGGRFQITYGKHQTTEFGNLKALLKMYCDRNGKQAPIISPCLKEMGVVGQYKNSKLLTALKIAGSEPLMQECQDIFFDKYYWQPAQNFFQANGFTLPFSMLVIYDSYIHSGGLPSWLRDDFAEVPPAKGGNEKAFITAYVYARDKWLENHSNRILRNTDYRTDCFIDAMEKGNWDLSKPLICKFNSAQQSAWITIN